MKIFSGHEDEGYAIAWSPPVAGRLVSGDCNNCIYLWEPTSNNWDIEKIPFIGHSKSIEDLQWSPTEADVFASSSVDKTIAIWDIRAGKKPCFTIMGQKSDVNVISWNRQSYKTLLPQLSIVQQDTGEASLVAHSEYHKKAITSIEWSPYEATELAVSSEDNQLTIWDLSMERDVEEEVEFKVKINEMADVPEDLPGQLLFVHQDQKDLKEVHWHPQIPGMIISTAADGFNLLMPSNIGATVSSAGP
ncbi:hypothetical protein QOZ80_2AG0116890 [Eleusine coracana subsp. coracana]|nr:hypothetical protein QOZ80_2AG0116890 [Eleusine coracana subsp. coracana]